ncbi:GIY-YIG nuclease family protein [Erythrobacter sp. GH1-10]|uniref:GIY-YIG nuclease family protein n=1 Tax=Erythrobacter sp. GH1-10 TaxID=3349334 RepID=UPI0038780E2C
MGGWVYIMTNGPHGTLYIGVTSSLSDRIMAHREGRGSEFCRKHKLVLLVYIEPFPTIEEAIAREKAMKRWKRQWKLKLIRRDNPNWDDLFETINA